MTGKQWLQNLLTLNKRLDEINENTRIDKKI